VITEKISIFFQFHFGSTKDPAIIGSQQVVIVRFDVGHRVTSLVFVGANLLEFPYSTRVLSGSSLIDGYFCTACHNYVPPNGMAV
jgi:hypothetical protein